ncbi:Enoyl-CoA hydratase/isomerase [gamma proteobacterium HdN1]|nr:Enoyl-CoA hydratase/isomerase [gamma proteobacterium HdN1]
MSSEHIQTQVDGSILRITIHRPEKKNALTGAMYTALTEALKWLDADDALRVGFITGTEDCFTSGNDLADFLSTPPSSQDSPVMRFLAQLPQQKKPLVAAVNGAAVGVGTTLLLHCDLVYAAPLAKFQMPFTNLGLCPEAGSSLLLPMTMGYQRAAELLMLGEPFTAAQAHAYGLVNQVFEGDYQAQAFARARSLAAQPPQSIRLTKALLKRTQHTLLSETMAEEGANFIRMLGEPAAREAMSAFMQKRKPDFSNLT